MNLMKSYRISIYVPEEALEEFVRAVSPEIPAFLGNYDHVCWWSESGTEQSRKIVGGEVDLVSCRRFECSLPWNESALERFIKEVVIPVHPWEEPVILISRQDIVRHKTV